MWQFDVRSKDLVHEKSGAAQIVLHPGGTDDDHRDTTVLGAHESLGLTTARSDRAIMRGCWSSARPLRGQEVGP
jgi:hypothetical protein